MNVKKQFFDGLINQNPSLVQLLGMCPLLAITTSMFNGLGMGLAVTDHFDLFQCGYLRPAEDHPQQGPYCLLHRGDRWLRDHG